MLCLWILNYVVSHTIDEEYLKYDTNKNWSHNRHMLIINLWNSINDVFPLQKLMNVSPIPVKVGQHVIIMSIHSTVHVLKDIQEWCVKQVTYIGLLDNELCCVYKL